MKRIAIVVGILSVTLATLGNAQGTASSKATGDHYTHAQLKELINSAHTEEQYDLLARYYSNQQDNFLRQAAEEKQEWERRSQNITNIAAKYPRPVDSARYLYEYYVYKASETGELCNKFRQLARQSAPAQAH
jgi:hypothetical protein